MTKETEVALAAIDALCKKRKAKALRKLVMSAVESERIASPWNITTGTISSGDVTTTGKEGFGWFGNRPEPSGRADRCGSARKL